MNHLMVKVKGKNKSVNQFRKVLSDKTIYITPCLDDIVEYDPATMLDEGQWYVISKFSTKEYCRFAFLRDKTFDSVDYEQLSISDFGNLDFLFSYQEGVYYFQNIPKSQLVRKKVISFGEHFKFDENNTSIIIKEFADAIYVREDDKLFFQKLPSITSILKGIDQIYCEATDGETSEFLSQEFISLTEDFTANRVKTANRRRIALALNTLKALSDNDKKKVFSYINDYCPDLSATEESFNVANENDLKMLLFGIEQRFYTTPVGDEKRIANSIVKIEAPMMERIKIMVSPN